MAIKVGKDRLEFCRRVLCDLHLRGFMREDGRSRPRRTTFGSPCRRPIIEDRRRSIRGLDIRQGRRFQRKGTRGSTLASRALATAIPGGTPCRHERHHCKGEKRAVSPHPHPNYTKSPHLSLWIAWYIPRERAPSILPKPIKQEKATLICLLIVGGWEY